MSDAASAREQRRREIEEKKKKLAQYQPKPKEETKDINGFDMEKMTNYIDSSLLKRTPGNPGQPSPTSPSTRSVDTPVSTPTSLPAQAPTQNNTAPARKRRNLSVQKVSSAEVDIPPREKEVYSKATQTIETSSTDVDQPPSIARGASVSNLHESIHAESSVHKKHNKEHHQEDQSSSPRVVKEEQVYTVPELSQGEKEKILASEEFNDFFSRSSKIIERALNLASEFDITIDYSKTDDEAGSRTENPREVTLQTKLFDERWSKHRSITDIAWSPKFPELLLASYSANEQGTNDPDGVVLVWSTLNTLQRPEYRFHCQSPVITAFFDPFSPTMIVGGTYSGQIVLWDTRARSTPVQHTPLSSVGHTHPVYSMEIVGTKNAHNLVSISTDGKMCVWSLENLLQPTEVLELHNKQSKLVTASAPVAVTTLSFPDSEVNKFFVGSEEGAIYEAHRHGTKAGVSERFDGHHGPITGLHCHSAAGPINFSDLILSSSTDWTCKLWNPKLSPNPIHSFEDTGDYVYDVKWCPSHPAIFATVDGTGSLDMWNLNEETEVPILKTQICNRAVNKLRWSDDGKKIVMGDSAGYLYVYETGEMCNSTQEDWKKLDESLQNLAQSQEDSTMTEEKLLGTV